MAAFISKSGPDGEGLRAALQERDKKFGDYRTEEK